jgi:hypothetical protein
MSNKEAYIGIKEFQKSKILKNLCKADLAKQK